MRKHKTMTSAELIASKRTTKVDTLDRGAVVYRHRITSMAGEYVVIENDTDWHCHATLDEAKSSTP